MANLFKKATRKQTKLKIAVTGPSGSGKTYGALLLAQGLGKKIAVIDTEQGSASLYADKFEFDTLKIEPPYRTEKFIDAIDSAVAAGYDIVIIDSISHAWASEGGLLEQKDDKDNRGGNSYTNWRAITKKQEAFFGKILHSDIDLICTMRSKQEYALVENNKGKMAPQKLGMAPIQRDGVEYEFTLVLDIAMDHSAMTSKDRTSLFSDQSFKITKATGEMIAKWRDGGAVDYKAKLRGLVKKHEWSRIEIAEVKQKYFNKEYKDLLTDDELKIFIAHIEADVKKPVNAAPKPEPKEKTEAQRVEDEPSEFEKFGEVNSPQVVQ